MLSISIVVYELDNVPLGQLLISIAQALEEIKSGEITCDVFLIDNGNQRAELEKLVSNIPHINANIQIFSGHGNIGYGKGHNLCINRCDSKFHLILNPDVILHRKCLATGLKFIEENPDTAAVFPTVMNENGQNQYLARRYPNIFDLLLRGISADWLCKLFEKRLSRYELRDLQNKNTPQEVELISGCFMLCNTQLLKQVGGFDPRFFLYFEDYDLSLRLRNLGKIVYLPEMKIVHYGGQSAKKGMRHIRYFISSGIKFFNKHGWKFF